MVDNSDLKQCNGKNGCGQWKPKSEYSNAAGNKDGLYSICRPCKKAAVHKSYLEKDHEKRKAHANQYYLENKELVKGRNRKYRRRTPAKQMLRNAKCRADKKGEIITITEQDILNIFPTHCPLPHCGIKLVPGGVGYERFNSPSLDKINSKGIYEKDNVIVVCFRCNTIKGEGTPEEHLSIGNFYQKLLKSKL